MRSPVLYYLLTCGVLIAIPWLGWHSGAWLITAEAQGTFVTWQLLATPHAKATRILEADTYAVYIQADTGLTYRCEIASHLPPSERCVRESNPTQLRSVRRSPCDHPPYTEASPPSNTITSFEVTECSGEIVAQTNYAVRNDGSVWFWQFGAGGLAGLGNAFFYPVLGAIIGFIIGIVVILAIFGRDRQSFIPGKFSIWR